MMKKLLFLFFIQIFSLLFSANITFRVDMRNEIVSQNGVYIAIAPTTFVEQQIYDMNHDGIYEVTLNLPPSSQSYKYGFSNGTYSWENNIRNILISDNNDRTLPLVCFNSDSACYVTATVNANSNSATISWTTNWPVDITFGTNQLSIINKKSWVLENLNSCTNYQFQIKYSGNQNSTTYNFTTTTALNSPANVPYKPVGSLQQAGQSTFCEIGWSNNTDYQFYQYDGVYYDITLGRSGSSQYLSTTRSSATSRGINLVAGKTYYIQFRPSIYSNLSNVNGSLKTSIGTNFDSNMQTVINTLNFSQIPSYTYPANQSKITIPFIPSTSGVYFISLYSDDLPIFSNNQSVWLHNSEFQVLDSILSNSEVNVEKFAVTPNPVKDIFEIKGNQKIEKVEIYSMEGKFLKTFEKSRNNISTLSKGIYLIKIFSEGQFISKKIVKE